MNSKSLRYNNTLYELMKSTEYNPIMDLILFLCVLLCFTLIISMSYIVIKENNNCITRFKNLFKKSKTDSLLPIRRKAKESPFIGPSATTQIPPKLEDSNITFRFRAPFRQEISFNEPDTYVTIITTMNDSK
jgi:hypothetical protein